MSAAVRSGKAMRLLAACALVLTAGVAMAAGGGVRAHGGHTLTSQIDTGDSDAYVLDLAEGGWLRITLRGKDGLHPTLQV